MARFAPEMKAEMNWWAKLHFHKGGGKTTRQTELLTEASAQFGCRVPQRWLVNRTLEDMAANGLVEEVPDAITGYRRFMITDAGHAAVARS